MGTISEFLGENVISVGVADNVFDLDGEVLFLPFTDKVLSEIEVFEAFSCYCFGPVTACAVVVVDDGGWGDVCHVQIGGSVSEINGVFDAFICCHDF